jgi:AhpD family alkylhydroperoxidase
MEEKMLKTLQVVTLSIALVAGFTAGPILADEAVDAARADIAATLGANAPENWVYPDSFVASTWAQQRAWLIDNTSTIPPKYRALIGLAVSSQIPCQYCIYADASDARVFGATEEEIKEAIMFAGLTRLGSTVMNGNQVDFAEFKAAIDAGAAAMREALAKEAAAQ